MIDAQRKAVYAWEDTFDACGKHSMTRDEVRKLVRKLCRNQRVPVPPVTFAPKGVGGYSHYDPDTDEVRFHWNHMNPAIVAHEVAHYVVCSSSPGAPDHGRRWFAKYLELLVIAKVAPRIALTASARAAGIEWEGMEKEEDSV